MSMTALRRNDALASDPGALAISPSCRRIGQPSVPFVAVRRPKTKAAKNVALTGLLVTVIPCSSRRGHHGEKRRPVPNASFAGYCGARANTQSEPPAGTFANRSSPEYRS